MQKNAITIIIYPNDKAFNKFTHNKKREKI